MVMLNTLQLKKVYKVNNHVIIMKLMNIILYPMLYAQGHKGNMLFTLEKQKNYHE